MSQSVELTKGVDLEFLKREEGWLTKGYIPRDRRGHIIGHSGVTIGLGIDLGQQTERGLRRIGVPETVLKVLRPHLGKQGRDAEVSLGTYPLSLPPDIVEDLDKRVIERNLKALIKEYNRGAVTPWEFLGDEERTVLYSLAHQYGLHGFPKTMRMAKEDDWVSVLEELMDFGDPKNVSRLRRTAEYLRRAYGITDEHT